MLYNNVNTVNTTKLYIYKCIIGLWAETTEAQVPRAFAPQQETPPKGEAYTIQLESRPCSPQPKSTHLQRPSTAEDK